MARPVLRTKSRTSGGLSPRFLSTQGLTGDQHIQKTRVV